jgi:hypothetical protein
MAYTNWGEIEVALEGRPGEQCITAFHPDWTMQGRYCEQRDCHL